MLSGELKNERRQFLSRKLAQILFNSGAKIRCAIRDGDNFRTETDGSRFDAGFKADSLAAK
jgi:hypothetical protein